jgi:hypothetical protein
MKIKTWLARLEMKFINTNDEIEEAMQAEINDLREHNLALLEEIKDLHNQVKSCFAYAMGNMQVDPDKLQKELNLISILLNKP